MEWKLLKVVVDSEPFDMAGVNIWDAEWISTNDQPIEVSHPSYPHQKHKMWVYEIQVKENKVKFAAGEFSNCVWGFYVPA